MAGGFGKFFICIKIKAVSYTHLDVYKRQGLSTDEAIATPEAVVRTAKALGTLMDPIISDITNVMYYDNIETA